MLDFCGEHGIAAEVEIIRTERAFHGRVWDVYRAATPAEFRRLTATTFLITAAILIQEVVLGYEVYLLTRAETYVTFAHHRGWTVERYAAWLRRSLRSAVDGPPASTNGGSAPPAPKLGTM